MTQARRGRLHQHLVRTDGADLHVVDDEVTGNGFENGRLHAGDPNARPGVDASQHEVLVDAEPAMGALVLGREEGLGDGERNDLRPIDLVRVPFVEDRCRTTRQHVLEPIRVAPVRQRDHEPVVGGNRLHGCFKRSAGLPTDVPDDGRVPSRRSARLHRERPHGATGAAHRIEHGWRLRAHPDHEDDPERRDGDQHAADELADGFPHGSPAPTPVLPPGLPPACPKNCRSKMSLARCPLRRGVVRSQW